MSTAKTFQQILKVDYHADRLTIPNWSVCDRPREKYLAQGGMHLTDAELLAILLRTGSSSESAVDLAKRILAKNNQKLNCLAGNSVTDLMKIHGVGQAKAVTIHAAFELGRRLRSERVENQQKINSAQDVIELMQSKIGNLNHEEFWVIYVNQGANILRTVCISSGGLTATMVDVRIILKQAIELQATGLFLCHNHPSGNLHPSDEDIDLTLKIKNAGNLFSISVLDHLIIRRDQGYSFYAEGLL